MLTPRSIIDVAADALQSKPHQSIAVTLLPNAMHLNQTVPYFLNPNAMRLNPSRESLVLGGKVITEISK